MNKDVNKRDMILFGEEYNKDEYIGGARRFSDITLENLKRLVDEDFISLYEAQNSSPTTEEFIDFMESHPGFTVFGYAISPERCDYRITIEGIQSNEMPDEETLIDFVSNFRWADEFEYDPPYAWWD